jgi:PAS domain-containing protein
MGAFARLVSDIYTAVMTPERWGMALGAIGRSFDDSRTAMLFRDPDGRLIIHSQLEPAAVQSYTEYYHRLDHVLPAVESGPAGKVRSGTELIEPHVDTEFHCNWLRPNGIEDGLFVRLTDGPLTTSLMVTAPKRPEPFGTDHRVSLMRRLVPHLQLALTTQDRLHDLNHRDHLPQAGSAVRDGVVIVAPGRRVVYANPVAQRILRKGDGWWYRHGHIEATVIHSDAQLRIGVDLALQQTGSDGRSFECSRPSGRLPYLVHVLPLRRTPFTAPASQRRAMVVIIDPEQESETRARRPTIRSGAHP